MSFRLRIKYYLIHTLNYTNKSANKLIASGTLSINGKIIVQNEIVHDKDEVKIGEAIIKNSSVYKYYMLNKPRGIESTFNQRIEDNLSKVFPFDGTYFIAGRLDKASEGLLLISNDGKWVNGIIRPENKVEKEYEVEIDQPINQLFLHKMATGVDIGFYFTQPCEVRQMDQNTFSIILTEGKNKQIRRMCKALGYQVIALKRVRIGEIYLADLQTADYTVLKI